MDMLSLQTGKIETIILLYRLSRLNGEVEYKILAEKLLEELIDNINSKKTVKDNLWTIGRGIEYLARNQYIEEETDKILIEIDLLTIRHIDNYQLKKNVSDNDDGIIEIGRYILARIIPKEVFRESKRLILLKEYLVYLIDWLEESLCFGKKHVDEVLEFLADLLEIGFYPSKVKKMIKYCLSMPKDVRELSTSINVNIPDVRHQITIVIPFRIDSTERARNLSLLLDDLANTCINIFLLEADCEQRYHVNLSNGYVKYIFVKDDLPFFYKTRYLNSLVGMCQTPVVALWDTDVIISHYQLYDAVQSIISGICDLNIPYNGEVRVLSSEQTTVYEHNKCYEFLEKRTNVFKIMNRRPVCGGVVLVNRLIYGRVGGQNESFHGWGPEDAEFIRRFEILGYKVRWESSGPAFHLWHPSARLTGGADKLWNNREEFIKVCCMDMEELYDYVQSWDFIKQ